MKTSDRFRRTPAALSRQLLFTLLVLLVWATVPALAAEDRTVACRAPSASSQNGEEALAGQLRRAVQSLLDADPEFRVFGFSGREPAFVVDLVLKSFVTRPGRNAVIARLVNPGGVERLMAMTYPAQRLTERQRHLLVFQCSGLVHRQLRIESRLDHGRILSPQLMDNVVDLDLGVRELEVELVDLADPRLAPALPQPQPKATAEAKDELSRREAIREKGSRSKIFGIFDNPFAARHKPRQETPQETVPLNPFAGEVATLALQQPDFAYPAFRASGLAGLILLPSLSWHETDYRQKVSVEVGASLTAEDYHGSNDYYERLEISGWNYRETISLSACLWRGLQAAAEASYGLHDSKVSFDIFHPQAPGGTTFLRERELDPALGDLTLSFCWPVHRDYFTFRPGFQVKVPTGSPANLTSSDRADFAFSVGAEYEFSAWHVAGRLGLVSPGDLAVFDPGQGVLSTQHFMTASLGLGRVISSQRGESISLALNYADNPLRRLSGFEDLKQEIITAGALLEKRFGLNFSARLEGSLGLTGSAPDSSVALTAKASY